MLSEAAIWWQQKEILALIFVACNMLTMVVCLWFVFRKDIVKEIGHAIQVFGVFGGVIGLFSGSGATYFLNKTYSIPQAEEKGKEEGKKTTLRATSRILPELAVPGSDINSILNREFGPVDPNIVGGFVAFAGRSGAVQPTGCDPPEKVCSFVSENGHGLDVLQAEADSLGAEVKAEVAKWVASNVGKELPPLAYASVYPSREAFQLRELLRPWLSEPERQSRLDSFAKEKNPAVTSGADWLARATPQDIRIFFDSQGLRVIERRRSGDTETLQLTLQDTGAEHVAFVSRLGVGRSADNEYRVSGLAFNDDR